MSSLSVIQVQQHLRRAAEKGHDLVSKPGSLILHGKEYPMGLHGIRFLGNPDHSQFSSLLPVNEGPNLAHVTWINWGDTKRPANPEVSLMHPFLITEKEHQFPAVSHHYSTPYSDEFHHPRERLREDPHSRISEISKMPTKISLATPHGDADLKEYGQMGTEGLKHFDRSKAMWETMHRLHQSGVEEIPKGHDFKSLSQHLVVGLDGTDAGLFGIDNESYLYHPRTEQLMRIK